MEASRTEPTIEQLTCAQRVRAAWQSRWADLAFCMGQDNATVYVAKIGKDDYDVVLSSPVDDWRIELIDWRELNDRIEDAGFENLPTDPKDWDTEWREGVFEHLAKHYEDRINEIRDEAFGSYGLCFDYVAPGTFRDQEVGYWRYQISWGGPGEEIRFYADRDHHVYKAEFWYLDFFDGAPINVTNDEVVRLLWEQFTETGTVDHVYEEAME